MDRLRVLYAMNGLRLGGMERQLVELIKALDGSQVNAHLAILNSKGPYSETVQQYLENPVIYLDRRRHKIPATLKALNELVKDKQIDMIHVQDSFSCYYALPVAKWNHLPLINGMIRHAGVTKGLEYIIGKWLLSLSDIIIANSKAGLNYFGIKHGHVMYNLIDQSRFKQAQGNLQDIVMNANFHDLKDHKTFFDAMRELNTMGRLRKIGLIGDGPTRPYYEQLAKEFGLTEIVTFYGFINNVEKVLSCYGIGVLCSTKKYKEGVSNSLLEYMGSGLVAVASDIGATSEIINDKVNGFLFDVESTKSLVKKIIEIQEHAYDIKSVLNNSFISLNRNHSIKNNIIKYFEIVKAL